MEITIKVPSLSGLKSLVSRKPQADAPKAPFGCYKDRDTGIWFSYWYKDGKCNVVPTPDGQNAKDYAKALKDTAITEDGNNVSYDADCDRCHGTGHMYGGKCYTCDGKGWLSPIDRFRQANRAAREAQS